MVLRDTFCYIFNMWAIVSKETQIVIGALMPDAPLNVYENLKKQYDVIAITLDNSPAAQGDIYKDGKFYSID